MHRSGTGGLGEGTITTFLRFEEADVTMHTPCSWPSSAQQQNNVQRWELRHVALCDSSGVTAVDTQPQLGCKGPFDLGGSLRVSAKSPLTWDLASKSA